MMPSAVGFLPPSIKEFVNFATSLSLYLGSGMILRFGTSRRRGICVFLLLLRTLHAVLGARAVTVGFVGAAGARGAGGVERAAHHVVTNTRQVLHAAAADQDDAVLLQVVSLTRDVADHFHAVGEAHAAHLAKRRVRLLRRHGVHAPAHAALLRTRTKRGRRGARDERFASLSNELLNRRHK